MDSTAAQLAKGMEEMTALFHTKMEEFEQSLRAAAPATNPTVKSLAADYSLFKTFVWDSLNFLRTQQELLLQNLDRLEIHSRRKVLLFRGVSEEDGEDVPKIVMGLLNGRMKLAVAGTAVEACHRLGNKGDKSRPILVRFTTYSSKAEAWRAKKMLKGTSASVSEFLTKVRQEVFVAARKHFGMNQCWSADGVVTVLLPDKTRKKVNSLADLKKLCIKYPASKASS